MLSLRLRTRHLSLPLEAGSAHLQGLRIGFVSDIHRSPWVSSSRLRRIAERLKEARPDLLCVGGDLADASTGRVDFADEVLRVLAEGVPSPLGHFVVPGNHDRALFSASAFCDMAQRRGFLPLLNEGRSLSWRGRPAALFVAGLDDESAGLPDLDRALQGWKGEPLLLLSHSPDSLVPLPHRLPAPLLGLSGHLHGGQVRLPGIGPLVRRTRFPHLFDRGWARMQGPRIYVSSGAGEARIGLRLFCPPEVCLFALGEER